MSEMSEDTLQEISQALYAGQKILAIKRYREATGMGLKEAKDAIEGMERMMQRATPDAFHTTSMDSDDWQNSLRSLLKRGGGPAEGMTEECAARITEALFAGQRIEAVKLYRDAQGGGLKDAKEAMDALEKALREECPQKFQFAARRGCLGIFLVGGLLTGLLGYMAG